MKIMKIGLFSFSDGRLPVHEGLVPVIEKEAAKIIACLMKTGEVTIVKSKIINSPAMAREEAKRLSAEDIDAAIFNFPVFAFPNFATITANLLRIPVLLLAPRSDAFPSVNGLLCTATNLAQVGIKHVRVWDDIGKKEVLEKVMSFIRASFTVNQLKGSSYGLIGGRSMGLFAGAVSIPEWTRTFGVDVSHIDEYEIVRRAGLISKERVKTGFNWLKKQVKQICFDKDQLTEGKFELQIRSYLAAKDIIKDYCLDFVGIKCHYEMSEYFVTQCLTISLLNDTADWEGRGEPIVAACEADSDGALTMQMMKLVSKKPVALLDLRHYDEKNKLFVLVNCGASAPWFAERSNDACQNFCRASLLPAIKKYKGGGAHVEFNYKAGKFTAARLFREKDKYKMFISPVEFKDFPKGYKKNPPVWPCALAKMKISPDDLIDKLSANHLHFSEGDRARELEYICKFYDIEVIK